jgi:hypothetical protein
MIVFDLACAPAGHIFEAWFGSTADYEAQQARGLVSCPICGAGDVAKAVMAPRLAAKGNTRDAAVAPAMAAAAPADAAQMHKMKAMLKTLVDMQAKMLDGSDYVGPRFAEEARAIHLGEREGRAIHGQATPEQAQALIDEGIAVAALPFPVRAPGTDN